jgi:hypothetical protein
MYMRQGVIRLAGVAAAAVALMTATQGTAGAATSAWTFQAFPLPAGAQGAEGDSVSCLSATDCTAAGIADGPRTPNVEQWNGSNWTAQELPLPAGQNFAQVNEISCVPGGSCMATGEYTESEGTVVMFAEHWNGTAWTPQTVPSPGTSAATLAGVSCGSATSCVAVGNYFTSDFNPVPLAEHWNGTGWAPQAAPLPSGATTGRFYAVSCTSARNCVATGDWVNDTTSLGGSLAEQWNGSTWTLLTTQPAPGGAFGFLGAVSCRSAANCTATGAYGADTNTSLPMAQHWNGSTWTLETVPVPGGTQGAELAGVSCPTATRCTATGWYDKGPGHAALGVFWNGSAWAVQHMAQPPARQTPNAISCVAVRTCEVVGKQILTTSQFFQPLAEGE